MASTVEAGGVASTVEAGGVASCLVSVLLTAATAGAAPESLSATVLVGREFTMDFGV